MPAISLVLASGSRYRRELLARLQLPFEQVSPDVDESSRDDEAPSEMARRLALEKATSVARRRPGALIIGSDQVASIDGRTPIGKPGSRERAFAQLHAASGRVMVFHTALALVRAAPHFERVACVDTRVRFRVLSDAQIDAYLDAEPALDCAGSAKSEGLGIALLDSVESTDPTALVGLPLIALSSMLAAAGVPVLRADRS